MRLTAFAPFKDRLSRQAGKYFYLPMKIQTSMEVFYYSTTILASGAKQMIDLDSAARFLRKGTSLRSPSVGKGERRKGEALRSCLGKR